MRDNRELIAAILTAGLLPTIPIPESLHRGRLTEAEGVEGEALQRAVNHAVGLYWSVLEALAFDP